MTKKLKITLSILAILFGAFMVVFGEFDDSPGAQGLGVLLAIVGMVVIEKYRKHRENRGIGE